MSIYDPYIYMDVDTIGVECQEEKGGAEVGDEDVADVEEDARVARGAFAALSSRRSCYCCDKSQATATA
jgi:hypothetical protein